MNQLEAALAHTNGWFFLREFFFSSTRFTPSAKGTEVELADGVAVFDDIVIVFQFKEREVASEDTAAARRWFERKVEKKAVEQVVDTIGYLDGGESVTLTNDRGDQVELPPGLASLRVLKIVVYLAGKVLPDALRMRKGRVSKRAGFVHFLPAEEYTRVLGTLVTVPEIVGYFEHRERLCREAGSEIDRLTEKALVGHYLVGSDDQPEEVHARAVDALDDDLGSFDISGILRNYRDRMYFTEATQPTRAPEYYAILKELARLPRACLRVWKDRFMWAWSKCGGPNDALELPTRFSLGTGCAFVMIPLPDGMPFQPALEQLTWAAKYDLRSDRCIGMTFRLDGEHRLVESMHIDEPWQPDDEMERLLRDKYPFRSARVQAVPSYTFRNR